MRVWIKNNGRELRNKRKLKLYKNRPRKQVNLSKNNNKQFSQSLGEMLRIILFFEITHRKFKAPSTCGECNSHYRGHPNLARISSTERKVVKTYV